MNSRLSQDPIAKELGCSSNTLRYRQDVNMPSPYRIPPNSQKKNSNREHDLDRPQMTSNDVKRVLSKY